MNSAAIPIDQAGDRIVDRCRQAERADRQQRRADGVEDRHAAAEHDAGDDQEAAADPEKTGKHADEKPDHDETNGDRRCHPHPGIAFGCPRTQHGGADRDHRQGEEKHQLPTIDQLSQGRSNRGAGDAGQSERCRARPFDVAGAPMTDQIGEGVSGNRERAGPDRNMRDRGSLPHRATAAPPGIEPPPPIRPSEKPTTPPESTAHASCAIDRDITALGFRGLLEQPAKRFRSAVAWCFAMIRLLGRQTGGLPGHDAAAQQ